VTMLFFLNGAKERCEAVMARKILLRQTVTANWLTKNEKQIG